jgi:hypothetical protein
VRKLAGATGTNFFRSTLFQCRNSKSASPLKVHHRSICSVLRHAQSMMTLIRAWMATRTSCRGRSVCVPMRAGLQRRGCCLSQCQLICVNENTLARMHTRGKQRHPPTHTTYAAHRRGACPLPRVEEWSAATRPSTPCTTLCLRQRFAVVTRRHSTCAVAEPTQKGGRI